jgi:lipopolysaccharide transport system permease protein
MKQLPHGLENTAQKWTAVISSKKPILDINFRELWRYRDFIILSVRKDLVMMHKQTIMGPLWYFIQPLFSTVVYQVIFGSVLKISTDRIPPFLFFMSGIVIWYYFSACLSKTSGVFTSNAGLFTKLYFPRLAIPISQIISNGWQFLVQLFIFLGFYFFFLWKGAPIHFSYRIIIIPVLIVQAALLGLGFGCWVASVTTRFRDLQMAVPPFIQLWMYGSCIFYPLSSAPPAMQKILIFNPVVPIIESFRFAMMGQGQIEIWQWLISLGITVIVLLIGLIEFGRAEKTMADTL